MNKKKLFYRALYDFWNSFIFINFLLYFSQWLVIDKHFSDFSYNAIFSLSSLLLLFSAPILAHMTDKLGGRIYSLRIATLGTLISYTLSILLAYQDKNIRIIAGLFLIGQYFYQLSFCFHNPLIEDVTDIKHRASVSWIGQFANNMWQVGWLILALVFNADRLDSLLPSIIICFLCSIPLLFYFKEKERNSLLTIKDYVYPTLRQSLQILISFFKNSPAITVLLAFFFFNDALITVSNNYSIYLEQVFQIADNTKNIILMSVLLCSAIWAIVRGKLADKIWSHQSIVYILLSWLILLPLLGSVQSIWWVIVCSLWLWFFMWWIRSVTRAYVSQILKKEELWYGFSFYTLFERFATLVWPLTRWWIITYNWNSSSSYRMAMISMSIYILIWLFVILKRRR